MLSDKTDESIVTVRLNGHSLRLGVRDKHKRPFRLGDILQQNFRTKKGVWTKGPTIGRQRECSAVN